MHEQFKSELDDFQHRKFGPWRDQQILTIDEKYRRDMRQQLDVHREQVDRRQGILQHAEERLAENKAILGQRDEEVSSIHREVTELKSLVNNNELRKTSLLRDIQNIENNASTTKDRIDKQYRMGQQRASAIIKDIALCKTRMGLRIETIATKGNETRTLVRFAFTCIDFNDWDREFILDVSAEDDYVVENCQPPLDFALEIFKLNAREMSFNDFIRAVRKKFQETVQPRNQNALSEAAAAEFMNKA
eukprot:Clim_evm41s232 gene=Clim_evmTU41s232